MRNLAKRIERALRNDFLDHEEANSKFIHQTWDDRQKIWDRIQEIKTEGKGFFEARRQSHEEFLLAILEQNCVLTAYQSVLPKEITVPKIVLPTMNEMEDDLDTLQTDLDEVGTDVEKVERDFEKLGATLGAGKGNTFDKVEDDLDSLDVAVEKIKVDLKRCRRCKKVVIEMEEEPLD